jgi:hypothetical protein
MELRGTVECYFPCKETGINTTFFVDLIFSFVFHPTCSYATTGVGGYCVGVVRGTAPVRLTPYFTSDVEYGRGCTCDWIENGYSTILQRR